jgi:hypothetical protein
MEVRLTSLLKPIMLNYVIAMQSDSELISTACINISSGKNYVPVIGKFLVMINLAKDYLC